MIYPQQQSCAALRVEVLLPVHRKDDVTGTSVNRKDGQKEVSEGFMFTKIVLNISCLIFGYNLWKLSSFDRQSERTCIRDHAAAKEIRS